MKYQTIFRIRDNRRTNMKQLAIFIVIALTATLARSAVVVSGGVTTVPPYYVNSSSGTASNLTLGTNFNLKASANGTNYVIVVYYDAMNDVFRFTKVVAP
jgi:hypothetical protein